jgi:low affinity Fe/Cu permease
LHPAGASAHEMVSRSPVASREELVLMTRWFTRFSTVTSHLAGHYLTFIGALALIVIWAVSGPIFRFSQNWQLVINTGTTIITFLMVFLIQNTQNRDSAAIHVKLDEIIRALDATDNRLMAAEGETEEELEVLRERYERMSQAAH